MMQAISENPLKMFEMQNYHEGVQEQKALNAFSKFYGFVRSHASHLCYKAAHNPRISSLLNKFNYNDCEIEKSEDSAKSLIIEECDYLSGLIGSVKETIDGMLPERQTLLNRENWMRNLHLQEESFGKRHLWSICIPGTHHSCVNDIFWPMGQGYAICQKATIEEQLKGGIRYFDLRVCDNNPKAKGEIWMSHHFVSHSDFITAVKEIAKFVKSHEKEIVIVYVAKDKGRSLSNTGAAKILTILDEEFGDMVIDNNLMGYNLNNLWKLNKKIAITGPLVNKGCARRSSWSQTKSKHYKKLINNITEFLSEYPTFSPRHLQVIEAQVTNRGISAPNDWNSKKLNPKLPKKLNNDWSKAQINIFQHDFTDDKIIDAVISRNKHLI